MASLNTSRNICVTYFVIFYLRFKSHFNSPSRLGLYFIKKTHTSPDVRRMSKIRPECPKRSGIWTSEAGRPNYILRTSSLSPTMSSIFLLHINVKIDSKTKRNKKRFPSFRQSLQVLHRPAENVSEINSILVEAWQNQWNATEEDYTLFFRALRNDWTCSWKLREV